jgi:N-acetylmuramoyl-L-alanine amidase
MSKQIVIIDYGHSSVDPLNGKCSPDKTFYEWKFNRTLGRKIYNRLKGQGITVFETVTEAEDNKKVSLSTRVARANAICDKYGTANCLFISIHANAAGAGDWMSARGWSVFVSKNCSSASKELANKIFDAVKLKGFKMRQPLPTQKYWQENFTVIYKTKCKAVLTESLFYDNKEDLALLKSDHTVTQLLDAHVNGILKFMDLPTVDDTKCECDECEAKENP